MQNIIIKGVVVGGAKKGRSMGFPTANVVLDEEFCELTNGVYVADIAIGDEHFKGVANIGVHPTVGSSEEKLLEVHIFDFDRDIYDREIVVTLHDFLRGERKFGNIEDLITQITADKKQAKIISKK